MRRWKEKCRNLKHSNFVFFLIRRTRRAVKKCTSDTEEEEHLNIAIDNRESEQGVSSVSWDEKSSLNYSHFAFISLFLLLRRTPSSLNFTFARRISRFWNLLSSWDTTRCIFCNCTSDDNHNNQRNECRDTPKLVSVIRRNEEAVQHCKNEIFDWSWHSNVDRIKIDTVSDFLRHKISLSWLRYYDLFAHQVADGWILFELRMLSS